MCSRSRMRDGQRDRLARGALWPLALCLGLLSLCLLPICAAPVRAASNPTTADQPVSVPATTLFPGRTTEPPADPNVKTYENNAGAIAEGAKLFNWMNCSGCHFHGAGGIGPPFFNGGRFIYGGRLDQIFASISQGRPNGMPSWGAILAPEQIWQLAAYVKSLSTSNPPPVMAGDKNTPASAAPAPVGGNP